MIRKIVFVVIQCLVIPFSYSETSIEIEQMLVSRNSEFREDLIRVSEHVYTATGIGMQPVSMIVGDDGLVIVDTNIDVMSGNKALSLFREISNKPVKAIIFTHSHLDHTGGSAAFANKDTQIWARANFGSEDKPLEEAGITITRTRGGHQFGSFLPPSDIKHSGIVLRYNPALALANANTEYKKPLAPTHTFSNDRQMIQVAGLELELVAASGETNDQLYVWFAKDRVVFSGDNFYKSWPNLYAVRGSTYRDVYAWINSLSSMLSKQPLHLVGGHTRPIQGQAKTTEVLTNYRDAIKHVFDKTIEGMNKGLTPDELVEYARLPEKYQKLDYLRPYYGHPDWGVRSIFNGYLGWFDGNPSTLFPLPPAQEAKNIVALAGGEKAVKAAIASALDSGQYQWALQLVDYLLVLSPNDKALKHSKAETLLTLAENTLNVTARNYYQSYALELKRAQ